MKKVIAMAVLFIAAAGAAWGQDIVGDWQGVLPAGDGALRIVLHVTKADDGSLKAKLDSPDQNIVGMPVDSINLSGNKLKFNVAVVKGSYEGTVKNASSIIGSWSQPNKLELDFKKTTTPIKLEHPPAAPSDIDGTWEGTVNVPRLTDTPARGMAHITFHIKNTGDGLTARLDSPELDAKSWPATGIARKGSSVKIDMAQLGASYQGKLNKDLSVMAGDWTQTSPYALTLKRTKEAPPADAPKTPAASDPAKK